MRPLKLALLDLNNEIPNQGMSSILTIAQVFKQNSAQAIEIETFEVRGKNQIPKVENFDLFISSGGPGSPHPQNEPWEERYHEFLESLWQHNQTQVVKKYAFLICYSFQLAVLHWDLGTINQRHSYGFGIMPVHKTELGEKEPLFECLPDPFFAVDSRGYQFIEPNHIQLESLGMKIIALEKIRPHVDYERAIMAVRFSNEIMGTQFHPEAEPQSMLQNLELEASKSAMIESLGEDKYNQTVFQIHDPDKIKLTYKHLLPDFLTTSARELMIQLQSNPSAL